jgi:glucose dehydrogenase
MKSACRNRNLLVSFLFLFLVDFLAAQSSKDWSVEFTGMGIHSSPRPVDLNQDGIKDLVIGCSKKEFEKQDSGVMAINGANGKVLWKVQARDQMFGSANFLDINRDGIPDVIIGGRAAELKAIDGKNGKIIWAFSQRQTACNQEKKVGLIFITHKSFLTRIRTA